MPENKSRSEISAELDEVEAQIESLTERKRALLKALRTANRPKAVKQEANGSAPETSEEN